MRHGMQFLFALILFVARPALATPPIPADARVLVEIRNLSHVQNVLGLNDLVTEAPELMDSLGAEMIDRIGINLYSTDALKEAGIKADKPAYIFATAGKPQCVGIVCRAEKRTLDRIAEATGATESGKLHVAQEGHIAMWYHDNYLLVLSDTENKREPESATNAATVAATLMEDDGSLLDQERYRDLLKQLPDRADAYVFVSSILQPLGGPGIDEEAIRAFKEKEDPRSAVAIHLSDDGIAGHSVSVVKKGGTAMTPFVIATDPVPFLERHGGDPLFAMVPRIDLARWMEVFEPLLDAARPDSVATLGERLDDTKLPCEIDLRKDLIAQVSGNIGLTIDRISLGDMDGTVFLQMRTPAAAAAIKEKLACAIEASFSASSERSPDGAQMRQTIEPAEIDGNAFYQVSLPMGEICFGAVGDHLLLTTSRVRYGRIVTGDAGSLFDHVSDAKLVAALKQRNGMGFYVDFQKLHANLVEIMSMTSPGKVEKMDFMTNLSELVFSATIDGNASSGDMRLSIHKGGWKKIVRGILEH